MTATGNPVSRTESNAKAEVRAMAGRRYRAVLRGETPRLTPHEYAVRAVEILSEVRDSRALRNWRESRVEIR